MAYWGTRKPHWKIVTPRPRAVSAKNGAVLPWTGEERERGTIGGRPAQGTPGIDQAHVIWHKVLRERQSIRVVVKQLGASPNAVAEHLTVSQPGPV